MSRQPEVRNAYNGLRQIETTLPSHTYWTQADYDLDLAKIWYRNWILVCRAADIAQPLDYRTIRIGTQEIVVLRDDMDEIRTFHNTCRHRGSRLCQAGSGRLKAKLITCPYHSWSYSLRGDLVRVPSEGLPECFNKADYPLYRVSVTEWRGFVFINLASDPSPIESAFDAESGDLSNWPLENLVSGHVFQKTMACNWKIFWENYNECLHCPNVHKHLSNLVPIYGRGLMARHDDPNWERHADSNEPKFSGGLRSGAETWSEDGQAHGPVFQGLTEEEHAVGHTYTMSLPSTYIVAHVDYVRTVRLRPVGPESTEITAEWLFSREALASGNVNLENVVAFGTRVLEEDAAICEINQLGLKSMCHEAGVLMPQEYEILRFHRWVQGQHDFGK